MRLPFLGRSGSAVALIDAASGDQLDYDALSAAVTARAAELGRTDGVALLSCTNSVATVIDYLAALEAGLAVMPLDAAMDRVARDGILRDYRPDLVLGAEGDLDGYHRTVDRVLERDDAEHQPPVHPDLAILLSTSGSTGSPRMVRLTDRSISVNTLDIIDSLGITSEDRAITSMPLHYSYGLSVLNSHLAAGASVVVSAASVVDPAFWSAVNDYAVTNFAGVPYTFAMLSRLRFTPAMVPSVRLITQAGGKLDLDSTRRFHESFSAAGVGLAIMYGQTEAGPRIACLPVDRLGEKLGSAGIAMSSGRLHIDEVDSALPAGTSGEVIYTGPNVMLGYATSREELHGRDDMNGVLRTGDVGHLDDEGFLFITGRIKRIAKLFGSRVSLDEVEAHVAALGPVAAVGGAEKLHVHHQNPDDDAVAAARKALSRELKVPIGAVVMHREAEFPLMSSGKVDYRELTARHGEVPT